MGDTKVIATCTVEERTPRHVPANEGWLTAEYAMLPGSTQTRSNRERVKLSGRTNEIQRLIGRSLRACLDMHNVGEHTFTIDADIIQADGGTRTASISAGFIALKDALLWLQTQGKIAEGPLPIISPVAAISIGVIAGEVMLDLNYEEDSSADVDANLVMNAEGHIIEFQTTSERTPLSREQLLELLDVGHVGIKSLLQLQEDAFKQPITT
jgi:ribonuclease PH